MFISYFGIKRLCVCSDINIPRLAIRVRLDVPPLLMRGSGTPTTGSNPVVIPIFTKTYIKNVKLMLDAANLEKRSSELIAISRPLPTMNR